MAAAVAAPATIGATLARLVETARDGEYGFRGLAEHVRTPALRQHFAERADDCRRAADELQSLQGGGAQADDGSGSTLGALHRGWVAVRGVLAGFDDAAMLAEAERGETAALQRYVDALSAGLPPALHAVVERQHAGVARNLAHIHALRR